MDTQKVLSIFILIILIAYLGAIGYKVFSNLDAFKENSKQLLKNKKFWNPFKHFDITKIIDTDPGNPDPVSQEQGGGDDSVFEDGTLCDVTTYNNDNEIQFSTNTQGVLGFYYKDGVCSEVECNARDCYTINSDKSACVYSPCSQEEFVNGPQAGEDCSKYPDLVDKLEDSYEEVRSQQTYADRQFLSWSDAVENLEYEVSDGGQSCRVTKCPDNALALSVPGGTLCQKDNWRECSWDDFLADHQPVSDSPSDEVSQALDPSNYSIYAKFDIDEDSGACISLRAGSCSGRHMLIDADNFKNSEGEQYNSDISFDMCGPEFQDDTTQLFYINNQLILLATQLQNKQNEFMREINSYVQQIVDNMPDRISYLEGDNFIYSNFRDNVRAGHWNNVQTWLNQFERVRELIIEQRDEAIKYYNRQFRDFFNQELKAIYELIKEHVNLGDGETVEQYVSTNGYFGSAVSILNTCSNSNSNYAEISELCTTILNSDNNSFLPSYTTGTGDNFEFLELTVNNLNTVDHVYGKIIYKAFHEPTLSINGLYQPWGSNAGGVPFLVGYVSRSLLFRQGYISRGKIELETSINYWIYQMNFVVSVATDGSHTKHGREAYSAWSWASFDSDPFPYGVVWATENTTSSNKQCGRTDSNCKGANALITNLGYFQSKLSTDMDMTGSGSSSGTPARDDTKRIYTRNASDFLLIKRSPTYKKDIYVSRYKSLRDVKRNRDNNKIDVSTGNIDSYIARFVADGTVYKYGENESLNKKRAADDVNNKYICALNDIQQCPGLYNVNYKIDCCDESTTESNQRETMGLNYIYFNYYVGNLAESKAKWSVRDFSSDDQPHITAMIPKHSYGGNNSWKKQSIYLGTSFKWSETIIDIWNDEGLDSISQEALTPLFESVGYNKTLIGTLLGGGRHDMYDGSFNHNMLYYTVKHVGDGNGDKSVFIMPNDKLQK